MTVQAAVTENGMVTHAGSGHPVLDFFFKMGGGRGQQDMVLQAFQQAYAYDKLLALKALFHLRDVREGMGERQLFRTCFAWLAQYDPAIAAHNLDNVPEFGRYDDLMATTGTPIEAQALTKWTQAIIKDDALAAKWAPREGKEHHEWALKLRQALRINWKSYRQLLVSASQTVEQIMCAGNWTAVNYNHVPSQAALRYRKAFFKRDKDRYLEYINSLASGKTKINAAAVHPHEIAARIALYNLNIGEAELLEAQWKALPDLVKSGESFLPIVDVSGSMAGQPMEVAIALGIYLSERNRGEFKNQIITFSEQPRFFQLAGGLRDKVLALRSAPWGYNTNVQAVFDLILRQAQIHSLKPEDMPNNLIILSDMQFDQACPDYSLTAMELIRQKYAAVGYQVPTIVFWNLRTSLGVPAQSDECNTQLVSGFSPNAMKAVLAKQELPVVTPIDSMLAVLLSPRYESVRVE
jgi:hypothetical protein